MPTPSPASPDRARASRNTSTAVSGGALASLAANTPRTLSAFPGLEPTTSPLPFADLAALFFVIAKQRLVTSRHTSPLPIASGSHNLASGCDASTPRADATIDIPIDRRASSRRRSSSEDVGSLKSWSSTRASDRSSCSPAPVRVDSSDLAMSTCACATRAAAHPTSGSSHR